MIEAPLETLARVRRSALFKRVTYDAYLSDIADRYPSHTFLRNATQGVYLRQVDLITQILSSNASPGDVSVLDWGTGKGHISYLMREAGFNVVSCDAQSDNTDNSFSQAVPIIEQKVINVVPLPHPYALPFPAEQFDAVLSFGVLEHVPDDLNSLKEILRVLKPGGILFLFFLPQKYSWTQRLAHLRGDFYHDRLYTQGRVRELCALTGFAVGRMWLGQVLPKNGLALPSFLIGAAEFLDRTLTEFTPLRLIATNIECVLYKPER